MDRNLHGGRLEKLAKKNGIIGENFGKSLRKEDRSKTSAP